MEVKKESTWRQGYPVKQNIMFDQLDQLRKIKFYFTFNYSFSWKEEPDGLWSIRLDMTEAT